ncbi:hypothetical protein CJP46_19450 [Paenibacillus sp. XY044]|nr:hypothetical protein CJP46_19450 [Paenibacillus sp. XY044]
MSPYGTPLSGWLLVRFEGNNETPCVGKAAMRGGDSKEQQRNPYIGAWRGRIWVSSAVEAVFLDEVRRWEHGFKGGT